jgi:uncharacterized protein
MRISMLAAGMAAAAVLAGGCGEGNPNSEGRTAQGQGQGDATVVGASGKRTADLVAYQPVAGNGTLPGITVQGSGTARAVPDVADWSFGVQSDGATASEALDATGAAARRIVQALRGAGIAREDIRTEQVSLYPRTTDDGRTVIGYSASISVYVTVRDLDKAGRVVDAAVKAGANEVSGPALRVADSRTQYRDAVAAALDDARAHAEALAAKAGLTLAAPIAIVENGGGGPPLPVYEQTATLDAAVEIEPGVSEITASLTVTFAIA